MKFIDEKVNGFIESKFKTKKNRNSTVENEIKFLFLKPDDFQV